VDLGVLEIVLVGQQFSETVVGDDALGVLLGSAVVGSKRGGDACR